MRKIAIGSDHAGFNLKSKVIEYLQKEYDVLDQGTYSEERADYPDFAHLVAKKVEDKQVDLGVLICGSANGIAMAANKHQGIRAAVCWMPEIAELARLHNDANIICLPARFIEEGLAKECLERFLKTPFEGGRHADRVTKISC